MELSYRTFFLICNILLDVDKLYTKWTLCIYYFWRISIEIFDAEVIIHAYITNDTNKIAWYIFASIHWLTQKVSYKNILPEN